MEIAILVLVSITTGLALFFAFGYSIFLEERMYEEKQNRKKNDELSNRVESLEKELNKKAGNAGDDDSVSSIGEDKK